MNIIDAWKKAKKGQSISRYHGEPFEKRPENDFHNFIMRAINIAYADNGANQINFDLLADDWEVVKQTKTCSFTSYAGEQINITKNDTKVVLTWKE